MGNNKLLSWGDVEPAANIAFSIWFDHSNELEFAREAWQKLSKQGLTIYSNELERHKVIFRFFALAWIYYGFCWRVFDEKDDCEFYYWADTLNLDEFVVGRCFEKLNKDDKHGARVEYEEALQILTENEKKVVYNALLKGYETISGLFLALYKTGITIEEYEEQESEGGILNDVDFDKLDAFTWLDQGCY